jgi:predicted PurR-regulated permease PerM
MSDNAVLPEPSPPLPPTTPPVTAPSWSDRLTTKQIAGGTLMVALTIMGLWLLVMLRDVIMLLFLGIVIGTALTPLVERLRSLGLRRDWSMLLAFSVMIAVLVGIIIALVPFFITQATLAYGQFPSGYRTLYDSMANSPSRLMRFVSERLPQDPFGAVPAADDAAIADQISDMLPSVTNTALASVFVLLLAYYWVYYRQHAVQAVMLLFPTKWRDDALLFWREAEEKIGAFVRGLVVLSLAMSVLSGIGFSLIGLPNAFTLAIVAGLLEAVPYVGPLILALIAALVGLSVSPQLALLAVLVASILQFLEGNLLVPRVMDREVGVHPVITLLAIGIFADVFGLLGALLAVPLAAIIQLLFDRWLLKAPSAEQLEISGRGRAALVRYHIQTLANDLRQRARAREQEGDDTNAPARLEAWLVRLDATLAEKERDQ